MNSVFIKHYTRNMRAFVTASAVAVGCKIGYDDIVFDRAMRESLRLTKLIADDMRTQCFNPDYDACDDMDVCTASGLVCKPDAERTMYDARVAAAQKRIDAHTHNLEVACDYINKSALERFVSWPPSQAMRRV
jgi:hypothetical protein